MKDPYLYKSAVPLVESKTQRSDCGGWGFGLGNNVSDTMRGVNSADTGMIKSLDETAQERARRYTHMRRNGMFAKSKRQTFKANDASEDRAVKPSDMPRPNIASIHRPAGSCNVAIPTRTLDALAKLRSRK